MAVYLLSCYLIIAVFVILYLSAKLSIVKHERNAFLDATKLLFRELAMLYEEKRKKCLCDDVPASKGEKKWINQQPEP